MELRKNDFVAFTYKRNRKYGRIREIRHYPDKDMVSLFVFQEWTHYYVSINSIVKVIPTVHNKESLKELDLKTGSKLYFGSYISAVNLDSSLFFDEYRSRTNTSKYPLRWTVKKKTRDSLILVCDWVVDCLPLTPYTIEDFLQEAFSAKERVLIGAVDKDGEQFCDPNMYLPDQEYVSDRTGKPKQVDFPHLNTDRFHESYSQMEEIFPLRHLFSYKKEDILQMENDDDKSGILRIEKGFPYWISSENSRIDFAAPSGWGYSEEDSDDIDIGFRPKLVIHL